MSFACRLRSVAGPRNHSEVARDAGISRRHLLRLMAADPKGGPTLGTVERLARAVGCDPGKLAFGDGDAEER